MTVRTIPNACDAFLAGCRAAARAMLPACLGLLAAAPAWGGGLSDTIERVKPSIVAVATFQKTRTPATKFIGTGFAVGDGALVATNAHVVPEVLDTERKESLVVVVARGGREPEIRPAERVALDREHDVALLRIGGDPLPPLPLGDPGSVREGQAFAFTGFPIGMALGFHPVTHRGMLSSIAPIILPVPNVGRLDARMISRLQKSPFSVYQLDGTAYPGNSGSPLYDPDTGVVHGIINMVFVKGLKETVLTQPSGITYAIPSQYVRELLQRKTP